MKALSRTVLAVTGLALSVACAPAFKGEGTKKPNLQRQLKLQEESRKKAVEQLAHIKTVKRSEKSTKKGFKFTLTLENVPDLKKKEVDLRVDATETKIRTINGDKRTYIIEARCLKACDELAAVLTSIPLKEESANAEADESQHQDDETAQVEEKVEAKEEVKADAKEESEKSKIDTQMSTTAAAEAPVDANLEKLFGEEGTQTGLIANKDGTILTMRTLIPVNSFEEQILTMQGVVTEKQMLKMK